MWSRVATMMEAINRSLVTAQPNAGQRQNLFALYVAVAQSHQDSIMILLGADKAPSAFALMRPLLETGIRGLWVNYKATDAEVISVGNNQFRFKPMEQMLEDLDSIFQETGLFAVHKEGWKLLCDFTHSGIELLSQMAMPDGDIGPFYEPSQLIALMEYALNTWMQVAVGFLEALDKDQEVDQITILHRRLFTSSFSAQTP